jgi:uncharacterized protein YkwD
MDRRQLVATGGLMLLAACAGGPDPRIGADGNPLPQVYPITPRMADDVTFRFLDGVNLLRQAASVPPVQLSSELTAAAATHSRDMSVQNRPWHFGSDGSSPLLRVQRTGYPGRLVGELISETYETELETLASWMRQDDTRAIILDPQARDLGFAWFQEPNGKIWWTMVAGAPGGAIVAGAGQPVLPGT